MWTEIQQIITFINKTPEISKAIILCSQKEQHARGYLNLSALTTKSRIYPRIVGELK